MSHINRIYVMTLERSNRLPYALGALAAKDTPMQYVEPVFGKDDWDYEKSVDLCKDAVKDGFEAFQRILDEGFYKEHPIAYLCQRWNYLRIFRMMVDTGRQNILLQDDYMFFGDVDYWVMDTFAAELEYFGLFKNCLFSMACRSEDHWKNIREFKTFPCEFFKELIPRIVSNVDTGILSSAEGAEWFIEAVTDTPEPNNFQNVLAWLSNHPEAQPDGNWTTLRRAVCPIYADDLAEIHLPSTVHTDVFNWKIARPASETQ